MMVVIAQLRMRMKRIFLHYYIELEYHTCPDQSGVC